MAFRYNDLDPPGATDPKFKRGTYSFPIDDADRYASKLQFQIVRYNPPTFSTKFSTAETLDRASKGQLNIKDFKGGQPATIELLEKCDLYMPQALQISDTFTYETPGLGAAGAVGMNAAQQGQGLIGAAADAIGQAGQSISDFVGAISGGDVSRLGAVRAAQLVPGETASAVIGLAAQAAVNPNIRAMFKQVNLRKFAFQFKFIPRSEQETQAVRDIIAYFRYHAYPESIPAGSDISLGYIFPDMFRIKAYTKVDGQYIQTGTRVKDCYLESISVTYNPTQATYHADGSPVETDLMLNFTEHKTLSREDVERPGSNEGIKVEVVPKRGTKFTPVNATADDLASPF